MSQRDVLFLKRTIALGEEAIQRWRSICKKLNEMFYFMINSNSLQMRFRTSNLFLGYWVTAHIQPVRTPAGSCRCSRSTRARSDLSTSSCCCAKVRCSYLRQVIPSSAASSADRLAFVLELALEDVVCGRALFGQQRIGANRHTRLFGQISACCLFWRDGPLSLHTDVVTHCLMLVPLWAISRL